MKLLTTPFKTHIKLNERSQRQWEAEEAERTTSFKAHAIVLTEFVWDQEPQVRLGTDRKILSPSRQAMSTCAAGSVVRRISG